MHGYLSSGDSFAGIKNLLQRDFEVFCPDLKGFGKNADMPYPYSLSDYVSEIGEYIDKNGLRNPHVIGHSFGGRIAIKAAAESPELFDKIVLCDAAGLKPRFSLRRAVKKARFRAIKRFFPNKKTDKFYSADYLAVTGVMRESFKLIVEENLDGVLDKIENETLIIYGKNDKETPIYMAKRLYRGIKNSEIKIIDGAGHFSFIDKPFTFYGEVKGFLQR